MARKKKTAEPTIDDLVKLASELGLSNGDLDDEIVDACEHAASLMEDDVKGRDLTGQLQFLLDEGSLSTSRLAEILRDLSTDKA